MNSQAAVPVCEDEVDFIARALIAQHGSGAAIAAANHLNVLIDQNNWHGRDTWAAVVCAIHRYQRSGGRTSARVSDAGHSVQSAPAG